LPISFSELSLERAYTNLRKNRNLVYVLPLLKLAEFLEIKQEVIEISGRYMVKYSLLPNYALVLATCKYYRIDAILSLDRNLKETCRKENIFFYLM